MYLLSVRCRTRKGWKMKIILYKSIADNRLLDKSSKITVIDTIDTAHIKDDTSIISPSIILSYKKISTLKKCNYLYIPSMGRYYYVNDIVLKQGGMYELKCHVDVLMTYKGDIRNITTLILRQENVNNPYIEDSQLLVRASRVYEKHTIGKVGDGTDHYYLTVNGGI